MPTDDEIDDMYAELHAAEASGADTAELQRRVEIAEHERAEEMSRYFWSRPGLMPEEVDSLLARVDAALDEDPVAEAARKMQDALIEQIDRDIIAELSPAATERRRDEYLERTRKRRLRESWEEDLRRDFDRGLPPPK